MDYVKEIVKCLENNTAAGARPATIFNDWLDLTHATLSALPAHLAATTASATLAADTPETQALFARCRARYPQDWAWRNFSQAFGLLLDSTDGFWPDADVPRQTNGWDVLGSIYMLTAANPHSGQFFTPWNIAELTARITIHDGAAEINDRLRQAQRTASARDDANAHLLAATLLAGLAVPADQAQAYFLSRILPLIAADFDPIRICDPCIGSGVMMLAAARQFPAWAAQAGLVQFYGMDIDTTCVTMAQCNMLLYGLNGAGLRCALTAPTAEIAALPEPYPAAYTLAQAANTAGDTETVEAITTAIRLQQALFDPSPFTHAVDTRKPTPHRTTRPAPTQNALISYQPTSKSPASTNPQGLFPTTIPFAHSQPASAFASSPHSPRDA